MNFAAVMKEIGQRLKEDTSLRVFDYPPGSVNPPAAIVSFPTSFRPNETYGRGMATIELPVIVVVGAPTERQTRDQLSDYCDGAGAKSVIRVLSSEEWTSCDSTRVAGIEFDAVDIGGTDYMTALFRVEVAGQGM